MRHTRVVLEDLFYLSVLSSVFLLTHLGTGSLASWDEAIYSTVAKEIVRSGHWFRLTLGGDAWVDKPPLVIWAMAFFYKLFGVHEFSARFFSALCGLGTVLVTYFFGRELLNRWAAWIGALVLLSSSHFFRFARFGMTDTPLTFFILLSFYFFWKGRLKNRYLIFSGIALGLAVMTKGLAAFVAFPIIWFFCWFSDELDVLSRSPYWIGVMIAVAIALPWNIYEMVVNRDAFVSEVLWKHLFLRSFTVLDGHAGSPYFYIRTRVNKYHPWILVGIFSGPLFVFKAWRERSPESILLSVWIFSVLGIYTLVRTKLAWYILPLYPALSLTVGYVVAKIFPESQKNFMRLLFVVVMALHIPYSHIFNQDYSRDLKGIAARVQAFVPSGEKVGLYDYHEIPAATFYLERQTVYLDNPDVFGEGAKAAHFYCLIHEKDLLGVSGFVAKEGLVVRGEFEHLKLLCKG